VLISELMEGLTLNELSVKLEQRLSALDHGYAPDLEMVAHESAEATPSLARAILLKLEPQVIEGIMDELTDEEVDYLINLIEEGRA
jgi:hypothetical protein